VAHVLGDAIRAGGGRLLRSRWLSVLVSAHVWAGVCIRARRRRSQRVYPRPDDKGGNDSAVASWGGGRGGLCLNALGRGDRRWQLFVHAFVLGRPTRGEFHVARRQSPARERAATTT